MKSTARLVQRSPPDPSPWYHSVGLALQSLLLGKYHVVQFLFSSFLYGKERLYFGVLTRGGATSSNKEYNEPMETKRWIGLG